MALATGLIDPLSKSTLPAPIGSPAFGGLFIETTLESIAMNYLALSLSALAALIGITTVYYLTHHQRR